MSYKTITPPGNVLTLAEVQAHLRLDTVAGVHPEDALVMAKLEDARALAQHHTGRAIGLQTIEFALDAFPASSGEPGILLPLTPVVDITSITYADQNGVDQVLSPAAFVLSDYDQFQAKLLPAASTSWPTSNGYINSVRIRYRAGGNTLLPGIRSGILLTLAHLYVNRNEGAGAQVHQIPMGARSFFGIHKVWGV